MSKREENEDIFEEMFEKQVHEFVDKHIHLIKEELNIFEMAKKFEDRYNFVISKTEERVQNKIDEIKAKNQVLYLRITSQRISQIETEIEQLKMIYLLQLFIWLLLLVQEHNLYQCLICF